MFIAALSSELSEKMAIGGKLTLMGILIVFGLLALIVIVLTIMERIMRKSGEKPKKEPECQLIDNDRARILLAFYTKTGR